MSVNFIHGVLLALGIAAQLTGGATASAMTINVDFNETGSPTGTYMGSGARADLGTSWNGVNTGVFPSNNVTLTSGALTESDGLTPTAVTVTIGNYGVFDAGHNGGDGAAFAPALLSDFVYDVNSSVTTFPTGLSSGTFSINNVPAGVYDLYVYSQNGGINNVTATFTVTGATNGASQTSSNVAGDNSGFVLGGNYLVFTGLTGGSISGTFVTNQLNNFAAFDGFQLVSVPEPSSIVLSCLGLVGLVVVVRNRRQQAAAV